MLESSLFLFSYLRMLFSRKERPKITCYVGNFFLWRLEVSSKRREITHSLTITAAEQYGLRVSPGSLTVRQGTYLKPAQTHLH